MSFQLRVFLTAILLLSLVAFSAAGENQTSPPSSTNTFLLTNDDGLLHSYVSYFAPSTSGSAPTLTFASDLNTGGQGIGGGYFGASRLAMLPSATAPCVFASDAGTTPLGGTPVGDIAAITIPPGAANTGVVVGNFVGSSTDAGDANGIGLAVNANYLYAGYSASNTIGTFSMLPGCQLSFLGDTPAAGLNGGSVAGMAIHGGIMVVAYADGSIESFNIADGLPVSNGDAQNSTGFINSGYAFPEGVDITSDGHFAVFGDSSLTTTIEVSDISSGHLTTTRQYTVAGGVGPSSVAPIQAVGPGVNSGAIRLSPDESMVYVANSDGGSVAAAFFNPTTGKVSGGCTTKPLAGFYNPWAFAGSVVTRDNTGTGGVLYVAEYGYNGSYLGVLTVNSNGSNCSLVESSASEVPDLLSGGLLSISVFPPRTF
jgi:hypothetical protein